MEINRMRLAIAYNLKRGIIIVSKAKTLFIAYRLQHLTPSPVSFEYPSVSYLNYNQNCNV